ncbi:hypothetical protein JCM10207_008897 [Rhodosporidiobolus poonsookiae]
MAYNQGSYPYGYANDGGYPSHPSNTQNPFASTSQVDLHSAGGAGYGGLPGGAGPGGATYPPNSAGYARDSTWSMDDEPLKEGPYNSVQRGKDNPYSREYKEPGRWKKWIFIGGLVLLVVAGIAIGIAVWRVKANDSSSGSGSSSSGKLQYIDGTAKVVKSNPNDPSDFEKDSRLKQIFYGLAYTPKNVLEEYGCGATLANVTEDIQLISQLTTRIRTYSSSCNQTQLVLQAIQDTKVNMSVIIGSYVGENTTVNEEQQQNILDALEIYGADHVLGVTIGNEYILGQLESARSTAISYIQQLIQSFNSSLQSLNLGKHIPVGTADAGSVYTTELATGIDIYLANVHPWFGGVPIDQAAGWTWDYFTENDVSVSEAVANKPTPYIAETGWPTESMTPENATLGAAVAGVSELQTFLDTYPCQANKNESYYFYFEPFDEPWKERYGGVEPYWGLFDSNKILKDITFPDCDVDSSSSSG